MSRLARQISKSGLYHIVFRGINKQSIFEEEADYIKMRSILIELKKEMKYEIYVYCLMSNHVHILLKAQKAGEISLIMKRLLTKYVRWYNIKYERCGALIANRYKSQPVEADEYFMNVIRYIHQNTIKGGLVKEISDYKWSSYNEYISDKSELADKEFVLSIMKKEDFIEFHQEEEKSIFIVDDKVKLTDEQIKRNIKYNLKIYVTWEEKIEICY